ncbi:cytochrome-c oxidase, cbb3-type subunit III [Aurantiacibacter xanthus]|uniref:Cbb3-type cytochrome c oxidase subunit n=1 Tax=Aurantiacibacter xanthus TaxID=1784712 RepID=A0A3A1P7L8_9SPHN|nr:cytochrome-c oxidase, cbb3-type subunit III [Aurantiacibacter xanthus]RIV89605.1 cytochrome-c oxidase, cbb3-type subunit III [Aurantiacibacter xanthus]
MAEKRIDEPTGTETVGHEWDGIEELDTPMPRWWVYTFYATIVWAIGFVIAYPAIPGLKQASEGMLGWSSRGQLAEEMSAADRARLSVREALAVMPIERLPADPGLMAQAVAGGAAAFKVNCVQCHGSGAAGSQTLGYANLNDDDWLWGGDLQSIEYTITNGVRQADHPGSRTGAMPSFAGAFSGKQLDDLASYVLSLSGKGEANASGAQIFSENCALCHGPTGEGSRALGAPRLNDAIWLRGGTREDIIAQVTNPKLGAMPAWGERLDAVTIKMLAAYVHSLGGGEDTPTPVAPAAAEPAAPDPDTPTPAE